MTNRNFKIFLLVWLICMAIFNVSAFAIPSDSTAKFTSGFWVAYLFIMLAQMCFLACGYYVFNCTTKKEIFYHLPMIVVCGLGVALVTLVGAIAMINPLLPVWATIITCYGLLGFTIIIIILTGYNAKLMTEMDSEQERQIYSMKRMLANIESLYNSTIDSQIRNEVKIVRDGLKYSDPVSNAMLNNINEKLNKELIEFENAARQGDTELVAAIRGNVQELIAERNSLCKLMK